MKNTFASFFLLVFVVGSSQEMEWNVDNTSSNPGERIVAVIDAGEVGPYDGVGIVGTVIDNNGNWGTNYPTVSRFTAFVKFSGGLSYGIIQDVKTTRIILRYRKISDSKFHLTANMPDSHMGARVLFRQVEGFPSVTMGNPNVIDNQGELVLSEPTYGTLYVGNFGIGNVGIGTTLPDAKLAVNGDIHAQEVRVDMTNWPDYVFTQDYDLPTLEEVERYITENGRLINIPSAQEVDENGVQLGEMNRLLLEKIEELTRYTLQQQKEIRHLKEQLQKMAVLEEKITELLTLNRK